MGEGLCGRLTTKWHVQRSVSIRWRKRDRIIEAACSSKIERESWARSCDLPDADSQQNAFVERAIWEVQSTARTLVTQSGVPILV